MSLSNHNAFALSLTEYTNFVCSIVPAATVNIAFEKQLLKAIDSVAKKEHRSRSELVREAVRAYIERRERWQNVFQSFDAVYGKASVSEQDVVSEVKAYRSAKLRK